MSGRAHVVCRPPLPPPAGLSGLERWSVSYAARRIRFRHLRACPAGAMVSELRVAAHSLPPPAGLPRRSDGQWATTGQRATTPPAGLSRGGGGP